MQAFGVPFGAPLRLPLSPSLYRRRLHLDSRVSLGHFLINNLSLFWCELINIDVMSCFMLVIVKFSLTHTHTRIHIYIEWMIGKIYGMQDSVELYMPVLYLRNSDSGVCAGVDQSSLSGHEVVHRSDSLLILDFRASIRSYFIGFGCSSWLWNLGYFDYRPILISVVFSFVYFLIIYFTLLSLYSVVWIIVATVCVEPFFFPFFFIW